MKIGVTGSSGLIGSALVALLTADGHEIMGVPRGELVVVDGCDAVVHLAGEPIVGRWTTEKKRRIRDSRVIGTRRLCETLASLSNKPSALVAASAIGYYGNCGSEVLREDSGLGRGFLAEVCREWEEATAPASRCGIRVVNLRIGLVLSVAGGALAKMRVPFRLGLGGIIGSGKQYWSWIALDDLLGVIVHCLTDEQLSGPTNAVAPNPVTNHEFTKTLGRVLGRPTALPMPKLGARLAFGSEMADELFLSSARVEPARLVTSGYKFRYPELETALRYLLGK